MPVVGTEEGVWTTEGTLAAVALCNCWVNWAKLVYWAASGL